MTQQYNIDATDLYESIRNGDEVAFSRYYEVTTPWLVPLIRRITKDVEEAWNIAQDTFAKLWQQREQIDPSRSLDGFVSKMANNAALNLMKRKQYHHEYSGEQIFLQNIEDMPADAPILASEMWLLIEHAIRSMPPQRRAVYELSREKNMSYNEIAERMNISAETVKMHVKLALKGIRDAIPVFFLILIVIRQIEKCLM